MIILSDCFTEKIDEGCLKVANSLARRLKQAEPATLLVSWRRDAPVADCRLHLNALFLNRSLARLVRRHGGPVLYIPFSSNTTASLLRTWVLAIMSAGRVSALFALRHPMGAVKRLLLRLSRASVVALSEESWRYYRAPAARTLYLRTGVDTGQFVPVGAEQKANLRDKYGIPREGTVVLHVGHLKAGRNVERLLELGGAYYVLLVVSSASEQDAGLRARLEARPGTRIIDRYVEEINEVYQLADAYLFPVEQAENCIDVPLSVLEAAACDIPVVTTAYGELRAFVGRPGFFFLQGTGRGEIEAALKQAVGSAGGRGAVLPYDWRRSLDTLAAFVGGKEVQA